MPADRLTELFHWQVDRAGEIPIFRQIYLQARSAILLRTFPPGTRLPSTRSLAKRLGVARATIASAYEQLFAEGYLSGKLGSGTYVSADLPETIDRGPARVIERPPTRLSRFRSRGRAFSEFPESTIRSDDRPFNTGRTLVDARTIEIWRKLTNRTLRSFGPNHVGYSDPCGLVELRIAICQYLRVARAVRCEPDQIIVTTGTQHAIDIVIRTALQPGDQAWVEDPGYPLTSQALVAAGVRLCPIPVDAQGMNVGAAIEATPEAAAAFVTPSHQFPLGVVLSMARRLELLAWARQTGAWIIEDDYASEYRYAGRPLASLQGLDDAERVIYVGTLNKTLFPGLRLGYAVVPRPLLGAFVGARYLMDRQPSTLQQLVLADFLGQGYLTAHIRRMRLAYRDHRDLLAREIARLLGSRVSLNVPDQGLFLIANIGKGVSDIDIERRALKNGVVAQAVSRLYKKARPRSALMLGFSGYPAQLLVPAVARFARAFGA